MQSSQLDPAAGVEKREVPAREPKDLTRRILWKLDVHVLPPLALVSLPVVSICSGPFIHLVAVARKLHRPYQCRKREVMQSLIAETRAQH